MTFAHCVRLGVNFEPEDLMDWYHAVSDSEVAIIAIPFRAGAVQIRRRPRKYIFWCPEGGRGVTESLEKAVSRLQMLQDTGMFQRC